MITTIYKCDRCGAEQPKYEQMWEVKIVCRHLNSGTSLDSCTQAMKLWCRKCCVEFAIIRSTSIDKEVNVLPGLSFEDRLREIIREEIVDHVR